MKSSVWDDGQDVQIMGYANILMSGHRIFASTEQASVTSWHYVFFLLLVRRLNVLMGSLKKSALLSGVVREARTVNGGFRRSRRGAGSMKIMENGPNMTHMALLGLELGQNECQRGCEFNGHPPDPLKPHRKFKMADFGPTGEW